MWHFLNDRCENSHCSPEQVAEYLAGTCSDGDACALSKMLPTRAKFYSRARPTEYCQLSLFGMMCEPLTDGRGEDRSTLSVAASRARISVLLGAGTDLMGNALDCGPSSPGSLAKYNPDSRSWRTAQCSLLGGLTEYLGTFPRWGTMRSGELWERTTPVLRIEGKGSGYWPTPQTRGFTNDGDLQALNRMCSGFEEMSGMAYRAAHTKKSNHWTAPANTPSGNWPTPTCADAFTDKLKSSQHQEGSMHSVNLSQAVKMWPTPTAQDSKHGDVEPMYSKPGATHTGLLHVHVGGQLNPDWVEWLMNWPLGWTNLNELNHDNFKEWRTRTEGSAAQIPNGQVQPLRTNGHASTAPQGSEQGEQFAGECGGTMSAMPSGGAHGGGGLGEGSGEGGDMCSVRIDIPAETIAQGEGVRTIMPEGIGQAVGNEALGWWASEPDGIPRVAHGVANRVDRLKAIGNGQVPHVAALAWNTLYARIRARTKPTTK